MARLHNATRQMALLATSAVLLLALMAHAESTNAIAAHELHLTLPHDTLDFTITQSTILDEPLMTPHTVRPISPRGVYLTKAALDTSNNPVTVALAPPMPRQTHQIVNPRALQETVSQATAATSANSSTQITDVAKSTQTLTLTETMDPITITITLRGTNVSSAVDNGTELAAADLTSSEASDRTSLEVEPERTGVCGTDEKGGKCSGSGVSDVAGNARKTLEPLLDGGSGRLGSGLAALLGVLVCVLWL